MSRKCAGANLAISVRNWASADRRAAAGWALSGTSIPTWSERRRAAAFFTLMIAPRDWKFFARRNAPAPNARRGVRETSGA
jgi:hypothetical protein